jgi:hypothetical protein
MDELEQRLSRYRPVSPPPGLRARVVAIAPPPARRRWAWIPSVAAAAAAVAFYVLAASARRDLSDELRARDPRPEAMARALAGELGGGEASRAIAARLLELNGATAGLAETDPGLSLDAGSDRHD